MISEKQEELVTPQIEIKNQLDATGRDLIIFAIGP
jgi:hypothetical protein